MKMAELEQILLLGAFFEVAYVGLKNATSSIGSAIEGFTGGGYHHPVELSPEEEKELEEIGNEAEISKWLPLPFDFLYIGYCAARDITEELKKKYKGSLLEKLRNPDFSLKGYVASRANSSD